MNLRAQAEADNEFLLEDDVAGFGTAIKLTSSAVPPVVYNVKGQYHRVGVDVDPETGLLVAGNKSSVTVRLSRFPLAALPDNDWTIEVTDILGETVKGKARHVLLDRTAGRATIIFTR
jgi:hypothetical protein